jgi:hypothetical protein
MQWRLRVPWATVVTYPLRSWPSSCLCKRDSNETLSNSFSHRKWLFTIAQWIKDIWCLRVWVCLCLWWTYWSLEMACDLWSWWESIIGGGCKLVWSILADLHVLDWWRTVISRCLFELFLPKYGLGILPNRVFCIPPLPCHPYNWLAQTH